MDQLDKDLNSVVKMMEEATSNMVKIKDNSVFDSRLYRAPLGADYYSVIVEYKTGVFRVIKYVENNDPDDNARWSSGNYFRNESDAAGIIQSIYGAITLQHMCNTK